MSKTLIALEARYEQLAQELAAKGVEYVLGGWVDVLGRAKSKFVPVAHLPEMIAGSERYTGRGVNNLGSWNAIEDECIALPDPDTLLVLPWDKRIAFMNADLHFGEHGPFAHCSRSILKEQIAALAGIGLRFNLGVETEFYVFREDRLPDLVPLVRSHSAEVMNSPAYDVEATLDSLDFLRQMQRYMGDIGLDVYSFDSEGGHGQYEFDFTYDEVLTMVDKLTVFRLMARQVAKELGAVATFMPKPTTDAWGSGAHVNFSLERCDTGENVMRDESDPRGHGWSVTTYQFMAGILDHARALSALMSPTVNSYKRLVPRLADGGISFAPANWATYGINNRSCMIRLPENRPALENRGVDAAANIYLTSAFMIAAGMDGIKRNLDPGEAVVGDAYNWQGSDGAGPPANRKLPLTLVEAVDAFEADPLVHEVFHAGFVKDYCEMKRNEWNSYYSQVTDWEREQYLLNL
jgi:glutamine synthetase